MYEKDWKFLRGPWKNLEPLIYQVRKAGGKIAFEWQEKCKHWKWKLVQDLIEHCNLEFAYCNGCALGMKVSVLNPRAKENKEKLVFKPWWVASDDHELLTEFNKYHCPGTAHVLAWRWQRT